MLLTEYGGKSTPRNFQIKLENCDITTLDAVTTTFSGMESTAVTGLLGFTGEAEGAGIAITDGSGSVVSLGPTNCWSDSGRRKQHSGFLCLPAGQHCF